jgi:hypothetical protein
MKLLIIFSPDYYGGGGGTVTPLLVADNLNPTIEQQRMYEQYEANKCTEQFEDFLRNKCGAINVDIDIFNTESGRLQKEIPNE